jgi:hypothetical protein
MPGAKKAIADPVFDSAEDTREVHVHPTDLKKTIFVVANFSTA